MSCDAKLGGSDEASSARDIDSTVKCTVSFLDDCNEEEAYNSSSCSNLPELVDDNVTEYEEATKRWSHYSRNLKFHPYKSSGSKRNSRTHLRTKNQKQNSAHNDKCYNKSLNLSQAASSEYSEMDCYILRDIGNIDYEDRFLCSLYITAYNALKDDHNVPLNVEEFSNTIKNTASGKIRIQRTFCGIITKFTREEDADKVISLPLEKFFGSPVQVVRFGSGEYKFRHIVVLKDVPWCISNLEIQKALKLQGIRCGRATRKGFHLKIEILNCLDMQRLLEEGLNFFNCTSFTAVAEHGFNHEEPEIIQCFKCQGFWHTSAHCRQIPRCVRCGENHDVEYCPRPRNSPICCHCGGAHHAACKTCPVRLQHLQSTYVGFTLAKSKPLRSYPHGVP